MKTSEKLYNINAFISGNYITGIKKPTMKEIEKINSELGTIIKEIRELENMRK